MTSEHWKPLLESTECSRLFREVATLRGQDGPHDSRWGRGQTVGCPHNCTTVHRRSRCGDPSIQHALSIRAGTECVAHVVQSLTSIDSNATVLSINGVGAYDFISRRAMFQGGRSSQRVTNLFHSSGNYEEPSTFVCEDKLGEVVKGENKETP